MAITQSTRISNQHHWVDTLPQVYEEPCSLRIITCYKLLCQLLISDDKNLTNLGGACPVSVSPHMKASVFV